jgi:hypothetical protein
MDFGMRHTGIQINDRIDIAPSLRIWINIVNGVSFNQLSGCVHVWTMSVIWTDPFLSSANESATFQYSSDTRETDVNTVVVDQVIPNHFSTALESQSQLQDSGDNGLSNCMRTGMRSSTICGDYPSQRASIAKLRTGSTVRTIVVSKLSVLIQNELFVLPAPKGSAVYPAAIRHHLQW